jgi:hypothetical protein
MLGGIVRIGALKFVLRWMFDASSPRVVVGNV